MLFQHGYLFRDEQPTKLSEGRRPLVYFIDQHAVPLLAEEYAVFPEDIAWKPKYNNVRWLLLYPLLTTKLGRRGTIQPLCGQRVSTQYKKTFARQPFPSVSTPSLSISACTHFTKYF